MIDTQWERRRISLIGVCDQVLIGSDKANETYVPVIKLKETRMHPLAQLLDNHYQSLAQGAQLPVAIYHSKDDSMAEYKKLVQLAMQYPEKIYQDGTI